MNRPTVEELIAKAESMKLDAAGVRRAFEHESAPKFADQTSTWLPDSDLVHERLLELLKPVAVGGSRILDLGAGTGRLTRLILDRFPDCTVVAADYSQTMRAVAAEKLGAYGDRVSIVELDIFSETWSLELTDFDAIVSGFAIHHGGGVDDYLALYQRIAGVLRPGGLFINLDHVAGEDRTKTLRNAEAWRDFLDEKGEAESDKFILGSYAEDTPISMSEHSRTLEHAKFSEIAVHWQKMIFALYGASKPV